MEKESVSQAHDTNTVQPSAGAKSASGARKLGIALIAAGVLIALLQLFLSIREARAAAVPFAPGVSDIAKWVITGGCVALAGALAMRAAARAQRNTGSHAETRKLAVCAMLTAMGVVLGGLLSIPAMPLGAYSVKIGLGVLPVILSGILYGPVYGGMVGGLTDFIQAMIFPKGAYMPWFTVIGVIFGLVPGLFFMKKRPSDATFPRVLLAVFTGQTIGSVICNTALLVWLYSMPWEIVYARMINQAVMIPIYSLLVYYTVKRLSNSGVI